MWRIVIASALLAGCADESITYTVEASARSPNVKFVVDGNPLIGPLFEQYVVSSYDELRDAAESVTVRENDVDHVVVLPFSASACGSQDWDHSGTLVRIDVHYVVQRDYVGTGYYAYADQLECLDDEDMGRSIVD